MDVEEYDQHFPHQRNPDKNVFIRVFNKLCKTDKPPSANITSERATPQGSEEVENLPGPVEDNATTRGFQRRANRLIGDPALTCHLQPLSHPCGVLLVTSHSSTVI
nr:unnamed protein product [Callosobruchus chinensis]